MSKKNIKLFFVLLILVLGAYLYQVPYQKYKNNRNKPENFLSKIDTEQINKIEIIRNNKSVVLEKFGAKWKIAGTKDFYTDEWTANEINKALKELKNSSFEIASKNKEKKNVFGMGDDKVEIKLYNDNNLLSSFELGSKTPSYSGAYLSKHNLDKIYVANANAYVFLRRGDWKDHQIFNSDKKKINRIRFQYPNREFTIEKKDNHWQGVIPYKFKVDDKKADEIAELMSSMYAQKIPEQKFAGTGLEKHLIIVQATGDGIDNTIMIGDQNQEKLFFSKRGNSDNIYLISESIKKKLDKRIRDFK